MEVLLCGEIIAEEEKRINRDKGDGGDRKKEQTGAT
jgi:hypothetical protein